MNPIGNNGSITNYLINDQRVESSSPGHDVDILVTLATLKDIRNWAYTSEAILKYISSRNYYLIVPDEDYCSFQKVTPVQFKILKDSQFIPARVRAQAVKILKSRANWYLQQFIKIEACRILETNEKNENSTILIWDSDTLPLKNLKFRNIDSSLNFYLGNELHQPYFRTLHRLLGLERIHPKSFISQCFPCKKEWVSSFCSEIQLRHNTQWMSAVIASLNLRDGGSLFSEYESLGTYFLSKYSSQMRFNDNKRWFRYGSSLLGSIYIDQLDSKYFSAMSNALDYLSFESWDSTPFDGLNIGCANINIKKTKFSSKTLNIDFIDLPCVDLYLNCDTENWYLPSNSYNHIIANSILEHVDNPLNFLTEVNRILKINGIFEFEVPFIGSYNHGTDITHRRGFTFNSFSFLYNSNNYLYREESLNPFKFKLIKFWRENLFNGKLYREEMESPPKRKLKRDEWVCKCLTHEMPGSFRFILKKIE